MQAINNKSKAKNPIRKKKITIREKQCEEALPRLVKEPEVRGFLIKYSI